MSRGMTIADLVQQVYYAIYKVRLDVCHSDDFPEAFHSQTDKFKEVVFEANFVLQELQKEQDWNWLRSRLRLGTAIATEDGGIVEFKLPDYVYKVCTGYNDAVRLHDPNSPNLTMEIPFTSPRNGSTNRTAMFDGFGQLNVPDMRLHAFVIGDYLTFTRPFIGNEIGCSIETDVIDWMEPLHLCDETCPPSCPQAYEDVVLKQVPDPYYLVARTAARRAEGDPSASDRVMSLTDEASKLLSAMRENDSSKTVPDTYTTSELGYLRIY